MGINWDKHLLAPLHSVFADQAEYRPASGEPYTVSGIFDRAYLRDDVLTDGESTISTTSPMLGVRDSQLKMPPDTRDRVFIGVAGGVAVNTLFAVASVQPDSHGGTKLILNRVQT